MTNPVSHAFGTMFYRIKLRVGSGKRLLVYQQTTCALSDHRHVVMQQQMILHMKNINELLIGKIAVFDLNPSIEKRAEHRS